MTELPSDAYFSIDEEVVPADGELLEGAPGMCYWTITGLSEGGDLAFDIWYGQSWVGRESAEQEYTIPIHVN